MTYVITQSCCNDASCVSVCPVNCIHPTPDEPDFATAEMLYIDAQTCIDCGACVDVCPFDPIHPDFELSDEVERYQHLSERYFNDPVRISYPASRPQAQTPAIEVHQPVPLRVGVVGAGPAGCYVAEELANRKGLD